MAVTKDSFFNYKDTRAQSGYRAAIVVKTTGSTYYSLLVASETVPSIFGTEDSFEFDLLNSPVKGKIAGKMSLEPKEVEVLHHRDNVYRFHKLKNQVLDFMYIDGEFVGYKFSGTLSYRVNDASADVLRGTYTITPISADPDPVFNVRNMVQETLCFDDSIPESIDVAEGVKTVSFAVEQSSAIVTLEVKVLSGSGTESTPPDNTAEVAGTSVSFSQNAKGKLFVVMASATGYASCSTTIYVNN